MKNVSRRKFIQGTGVVSGGLILGMHIPSAVLAFNDVTDTKGKELNLFVQVREDGDVNIICSRSEMGQGIRTGLPQVVADELEADWERVHVIQAIGDAKYGSQNTDGSRSVRKFYQTMRQSGAAARSMLEQAAAKTWKTDLKNCYADNHYVINRLNGNKLSFGELAPVASGLPVPDNSSLTLKSKKQFKYIGKGLAQVDNEAIISGKAVYGMDINLPGMLHASIERCPIIGAGVEKFDASDALKQPGVVDAIKMENKGLPVVFKALPGVAVIASNSWAAMQGRKKLKIQWQQGDNSQYSSESYQQQLKKQIRQSGIVVAKKGDIKQAQKQANSQLEAEYFVPNIAHAPMETTCATAQLTEKGMEVWACTQTPQSCQQNVAQAVGLKPEQVTVHVTLLGGGFGRKSKPDFAVEAAILAHKLKQPVKVTWTREDDIQFDYYHAVSAQSYSATFDKNKQLTGLLARTAFPTISSTFAPNAQTPSATEVGLGFADLPFEIDHLQMELGQMPAHIRIGWVRSVSNIHHAFARNSFVDEIAHFQQRNPKDVWLDLIGADRHIDFSKMKFDYSNYGESIKEYPYDTARLKAVINQVTKKSGWGKPLQKNQGMGLAVHRSFLTDVAMTCLVEVVDKRLKIQEIHAAIDCGTVVNPDRVKAQIEGGIIFGLTIALYGNITAKNGKIEQSNFHDYQMLRMNQCPKIHVHLNPSDAIPTGVGEPGTPPVAAALTNAIFNASGQRYRTLPLYKELTV